MSDAPGRTASSETGEARPVHWVSVLQLVLLGTMWGAGFSLGRVAVLDGIAPIGFAAWQSAGGFALVLLVLRLRGASLAVNSPWLLHSAITGMLGIAAPNLVAFTALRHVTASHMAVITNLSPLFAFVLSYLTGSGRTGLLSGIAVVSGFLGVCLLLIPSASSGPLDPWAMLGILTPLSLSCSIVYAAKYRPGGFDALHLAAGSLGCAAVVLWSLAIATGQSHLPRLPLRSGEYAIGGIVVTAGLTQLLNFVIIRREGVNFRSYATYITTISGILLGAVVLGEDPPTRIWASAALVMAGMFILRAGERNARAR